MLRSYSDPYIVGYKISGQVVILNYSDGDFISIFKSDFDRAFGPIIAASKESVLKDYGFHLA